AWYADPYEIADQSWWDGGKWTDAVRQTPQDDALASQPPVSIGSRFPVNMQTVVGEMLRVVPTDRAPSKQLRRELGLTGLRAVGAGASWTPGEFQVLAAAGLVASLSLGVAELMRLACTEGAWSVQKQGRRG